MARQISTRNSKLPTPVIIGAGITEQWYFTHLRNILDLRIKIRPRFFGTEDIKQLDKKISQVVNEGSIAICVFDTDTCEFNPAEKKKIDDLKKKYSGKRNVVLCDSLPSLEYWFLLHYADTNKYFANCHALLQELKKFIPEYKKSEAFLQSPQWVEDMTLEGKLATAVERSKKYEGQGGSYSNVYKAIDIMCQTK